MLQPDGRTRYLNTAGFAIQRGKADIENGVFDPHALRGEDAFLLANLMQIAKLASYGCLFPMQSSNTASHSL